MDNEVDKLMRFANRGYFLIFFFITLSGLLGGCAKKPEETVPAAFCAPSTPVGNNQSIGEGLVFDPDPMTQSGNPNLTPALKEPRWMTKEVSLSHLTGKGVLEGEFVEVRNGLDCQDGFGAFEQENRFSYFYSDHRFQEVMSYYFGDEYQSFLNTIGGLVKKPPIQILAHCMNQDNAYFAQSRSWDGVLIDQVCLGDSVATPGASYADDAMVLTHELQHAATADAYSSSVEMQSLWYDEAGAINEGISDFMALGFFEPTLSVTSFDPRVFSRWALGLFIPNHVGLRGAHLCPIYDSDYPDCRNFKSDASGFSAEKNTVSFVYPDGLGWPYSKNFKGPGLVQSAFSYNPSGGNSQEEIHLNGSIITGALWDIFSSIAFQKTAQLILKSLSILPKPTLSQVSPVHFRNFATALVSASQLLGFSQGEQEAIKNVLEKRGLYGPGALLAPGWAKVGAGTPQTAGIKLIDNPTLLKGWVRRMGGDAQVIPQGIETGMNGLADPGEVFALWFDIENSSEKTAGGVLLTVTSLNSKITFLGGRYNFGILNSAQAQIQYAKINGAQIVQALHSQNPALKVQTGNRYFTSNPTFSNHWQTALWIKVNVDVPHGTQVPLRVQVSPANASPPAPSETLEFNLKIQ